MKAGIPRSEWIVRDVTGDAKLERRLSEQLKGSKLTNSGIDAVRQRGVEIRENARPVGWPYDLPPESEPFDWRRLGAADGLAEFAGDGNGAKPQN
jgi:hypothetical protein